MGTARSWFSCSFGRTVDHPAASCEAPLRLNRRAGAEEEQGRSGARRGRKGREEGREEADLPKASGWSFRALVPATALVPRKLGEVLEATGQSLRASSACAPPCSPGAQRGAWALRCGTSQRSRGAHARTPGVLCTFPPFGVSSSQS